VSNVAADLEAAANAAESSELDPRGTVKVLVSAVRKAVADIRATVVPVEAVTKPRKSK
jgi:hypothetical protein